MTASERRHNLRAENCRACGALCEAGAGYLYRDTNGVAARRRFDRSGRWGWFVKCEKCHNANATRLTVRMEKDAAARADEPVIRPWSVAQVKKWAVVRTVADGDVAIRVEAATFAEVISYRDRINSSFRAPTGYALEQHTFAGKPLSEAAAKYLTAVILPLVIAVQNEEQAGGEAAAVLLAAAGATVTRRRVGTCWNVEFRGGHFTLWGSVGGNRVYGLVNGQWAEMTAEELIAN